MNKMQRTMLEEFIQRLEDIKSELEQLSEEEQDKFDNLPENLQGGEKAEAFQTAADTLTEQADAIGDIIDALQEL